jgi:hypothetical protein
MPAARCGRTSRILNLDFRESPECELRLRSSENSEKFFVANLAEVRIASVLYSRLSYVECGGFIAQYT